MSATFLPNAHAAIVQRGKVRDYLLDPDHPGNGGKAAFFRAFGFARLTWTALRGSLHEHPRVNLVALIQPNPFGTRYVVRCSLTSPDGRNPCITTVWIIDHGDTQPRLVTAFP
jgi:hypothetical protein